MLRNKLVVTLEGNIGAGKTTILKALKEKLGNSCYVCVPEPVDYFKFSQVNGRDHNPLQCFYNNSKIYAESLQWWVRKSYDKQLNELSKFSTSDSTIITDRGIYASTIFVKANHHNGTINPFAHDFLINEIDETIVKYFGAKCKYGANKLYYINTPVEKCFENLQIRNRHEEKQLHSVSMIPYLQLIEQFHNDYITKFKQEHGEHNVKVGYFPTVDKTVEDIIKFIDNS